jgi:rubrerythrin
MSDIDLLNKSLASEYFGVAAYEAAIGTGFLDAGTSAVARKFQSQHGDHAARFRELLVERGATPVNPRPEAEYAAEFPPLGSAADVIAYAIELESGAAHAETAAVGLYQDRALAVVAAQIGAVEAMHWAALLAATGADPVPHSFIELPLTA